MEQSNKPEQEHPLIRLTNFEAEEAVLGGILIDPEALFEVSHFLEPKHFFRDINAWIYEAFLTLVNINRPLDLITVTDELRRRERLEQIGGEAYIIGLINTVPTAINTFHYGKIVEALRTRRELVGAAEAILNLALDEDQELEAVMSASERVLFDIGHNGSTGEIRHIRDIAGDHMDKIERINAGEKVDPPIKTGFMDVDKILSAGGLEKGQLVMIPADTGMGKSSLLIDIMINAARAGHKGALFTLEMTDESVFQRKVGAEARIPVKKLKQPKEMEETEWVAYYEALGKLSELPVHIDDSAFLTPMQLLSKCRRLQATEGLDIVAVDYLALMTADGDTANETLRIGSISRTLKLIAKELNVVMIVCAQLNAKQIAVRQDQRPQLADLRFSSDPNNDSDVVIFIYRDDYYNPETAEKGIAEFIFGKHREGATPTVMAYWDEVLMTFRDLARVDTRSMVPMRGEYDVEGHDR